MFLQICTYYEWKSVYKFIINLRRTSGYLCFDKVTCKIHDFTKVVHFLGLFIHILVSFLNILYPMKQLKLKYVKGTKNY